MVSRTRRGHVLVWEQSGLEDQGTGSGEIRTYTFDITQITIKKKMFGKAFLLLSI